MPRTGNRRAAPAPNPSIGSGLPAARVPAFRVRSGLRYEPARNISRQRVAAAGQYQSGQAHGGTSTRLAACARVSGDIEQDGVPRAQHHWRNSFNNPFHACPARCLDRISRTPTLCRALLIPGFRVSRITVLTEFLGRANPTEQVAQFYPRPVISSVPRRQPISHHQAQTVRG